MNKNLTNFGKYKFRQAIKSGASPETAKKTISMMWNQIWFRNSAVTLKLPKIAV